jgi:hypothetical protein
VAQAVDRPHPLQPRRGLKRCAVGESARQATVRSRPLARPRRVPTSTTPQPPARRRRFLGESGSAAYRI